MHGTQVAVPNETLIDEFATFLAATGTVLRETLTRFERTSTRISQRVTAEPRLADRALIVMLQDFDRLQQEFSMVVQVLICAAEKSGESWLRRDGSGHPAEDAIAKVSIAELKERLQRLLDDTTLNVVPTTEEVEF